MGFRVDLRAAVVGASELEEGFLNQTKRAFCSVFNRNGDSLSKRFTNAKKNWTVQGELDDLSNLQQQLIQLIDANQINPQMTIAQFIGGKYNNNRYGKLTSLIGNRQSQIKRHSGTAY